MLLCLITQFLDRWGVLAQYFLRGIMVGEPLSSKTCVIRHRQTGTKTKFNKKRRIIMTKRLKRILAFILALALVVSGISYSPRTVSADSGVDWSTIQFLGDGAGGGAYTNKYKVYAPDAREIVNIQKPGWASEAGFYIAFPAGITECSVPASIDGAGIVLHLSAYTAQETRVVIKSGATEWVCWVYYADGTGIDEGEGGGSGEGTTTTSAEVGAPTAPTGLVANINDLKTNYTIAFAAVNGANAYKFYLNGEYVRDITNGGVVTFDELGLQGNTQYTFGVSAYNSAGESAVSTVTVTTPQSGTLADRLPEGFTTLPSDSSWVNTDGWDFYATNAVVKGGYLTVSNTSAKLYVDSTNKGEWQAQARYQCAVESGEAYKVVITLSTDKAARVGIKEDVSNTALEYKDISVGTNVIEMEYTANANQTSMNIMFELGTGVNAGTTLSFDNIVVQNVKDIVPDYEKDAFERVEAEAFDEKLSDSGVADTNANLSGGGNLGGVASGTLTGYHVYFDKAAGQMTICYVSPSSGASGYVEVYIDTTEGTPAATIQLPNTFEGSGWDPQYYGTVTADIFVPAGNHKIYTKYVATNGMYYAANVDYIQFLEPSEDALEWQTDANLTAGCGDGSKYAIQGTFPDGSVSFNTNGINVTSGAMGTGITVSLNGTQKAYSGNYAVGLDIPYTDLSSGMNELTITGTHNTAGAVNVVVYINLTVRPVKVVVNDYSAYTGKYIVKFEAVEDAASYKVYIDGAATDIILGGSGDYFTCGDLSAFGAGNHTVQISAVLSDGTETAKSGAVTINKPDNAGNYNDVPQVYVQTDDTSINALGIVKSMDNLPASITVVDPSGTYSDIYEDLAKTTIKVRGNSTAMADKKAFNIKFKDKVDLFGMGKAKKWSLLANAFDKSLIRTKVAMELGILLGVPYTSQSKYIDLYLNGRYMGSYLAIESVETGDTRVNIDSENDEEYNGDVLLELENSMRFEDGGINFQTTTYGQWFIFNSPETVEDSTQEFVDQKLIDTQALLNQFEVDLSQNDFLGYSEYIDLESFVNFYLLFELFKHQDIAFSSTRFFIDDGVLYAGPPWDFDLSSGNVSIGYYGEAQQSNTGYKATDMIWFAKLMANQNFKNLVIERFQEMLPTIKSLYDNTEDADNLIDDLMAEMGASAQRNYTAYNEGGAGWSINVKDSGDGYSYANSINPADYDEYSDWVEYFRTWLTGRVAFLEGEWDEVVEVVETYTYNSYFLGAGTTFPDTLAVSQSLNHTNYLGTTKGAEVTATGSTNVQAANLAMDGNAASRWESERNDNQSITFYLGQKRSVKEIFLSWESANAKDFKIRVSNDGINYITVATITGAAANGTTVADEGISLMAVGDNTAQGRVDSIVLDEAVAATYVMIEGTARNTEYGYSIYEAAIYGDADADLEDEIPETPTIAPTTEPDGATWVPYTGSDKLLYYIPDAAATLVSTTHYNGGDADIYWAFGLAAPFSSVTVNGTAITPDLGAQVYIDPDMLSVGCYELTVTDYYGTASTSVWIKKIPDYKPTGFAATITDGIATMAWVPSEYAVQDGYTYEVTFNGEQATVNGSLATYDVSSLEYGFYTASIVTKDPNGNVIDTQNITVRHKDPEAVDSTVTYKYLWEAKRSAKVMWTEVADATGYAIYADGTLFDVTTALEYYIPAYAFANGTNSQNQPTTVGTHTYTIVALFNNETVETAPVLTAAVNSKHIMTEESFRLFVNYIYGNTTNIWNDTGIDSVWNFTVCEDDEAGDIVDERGAVVYVDYDSDGASNITLLDRGRHETYGDLVNTGDQAWTIKAAIYDQPITAGELLNLSFDIKGPAFLIGQQIQIKCVPEECDENDVYFGVDQFGYEEKKYTFESAIDAQGEEYAVLHYTASFETTNDTYDLLFGLGLLHIPADDEDGEQEGSIDISLSDTSVTKVYGVTSVTATGIPNADNKANNSGYISWTTDVPDHLSNEYTYTLVVKNPDGTVLFTKENATNNDIYEGFALETEYTVEVSSIYNGSVTATKSTTMIIEDTSAPDLVITDISIPNQEYRVGDTVPVSVTMTNIGTADATAGANLTIHLHLNNANGTMAGYSVEPDKTLAPGESYTGVINYLITEADSDGNDIYTFFAEADADIQVTESDETNNTYTKKYQFLPQPEVVTLTNNGTNIVGTWPELEGTTTYTVEYTTKDGTVKTTEVNTNSITFPAEDELKNNSKVNVYVPSGDGSSYLYAQGTPLPDIVIESIVAENGVAYMGQENTILVTLKNVGTAAADYVNQQERWLGVVFTDTGVFTGWQTMEDNEGLGINESATLSVYGYNPTVAGPTTLNAIGDDVNRIVESNETNNNGSGVIVALNKGTITLTNTDGVVSATWTDNNTDLTNTGYTLTYTSNGVTETVEVPAGTTTYAFPADKPLDNNTTVTVAGAYTEAGEAYYDLANTTAMVDLIITGVEMPEKTYVDEAFNATVTFKNVGTAQVAPSTDNLDTDYGKWIIVGMQEDANLNANAYLSAHTIAGLVPGASDTVVIENITASVVGDQNITFKVDDPGYDLVEAMGHIAESDETNNTYTVTANIEKELFIQEKMDWTLFTATDPANLDSEGNPVAEIANGSDRRPVEYKILDTSITDEHYLDILPAINVVAYGGPYISLGFNSATSIVQTVDGEVTSKMYFAQVAPETAEEFVPGETVVDYGDERFIGDGTFHTWNGNGAILHTRSFAAGKYYIMNIVNDDGTYMTVGFRIPGDLDNWVKAKASDDSDPDKVPVVYHDANHVVDGTIYYDASDLGLSALSVYNGNHLAITTDSSKPLNLIGGENWKMEIEYAHYDENGNLVAGVPEDILEEIGYDPGVIELPPTYEVYGSQGANTILIKLPELMQDLPIHSELGGERDNEYYILKVYNDTVNYPEDYIYIPLNIYGEIPMIESVEGLAVAGRADTLTVSWTSTPTQIADGYVYDVYIDKNDDGDFDDDGELVSADVLAGTYNYTEGLDVANAERYGVQVVAKWCQQTTADTAAYVRPEQETIPADTPDYPENSGEHEWVLINGEYVLPIKNGNSTINAEIWYYTDDDMYSVDGYNGYYIALNGNPDYFVGGTSTLFVQDGEDDPSFESKNIYDNFYDGQILMNAANMFTTYGDDLTAGTELYYTVKVVGEDGNAKDFYFKAVLTEDGTVLDDEGEWRLISGKYNLPVKYDETTYLEGTIYYYDHPSVTQTYDLTGFNGYFISATGNTAYYSGETTTMSISGASETVLYAEDAAGLSFEDKAIYDKVFDGEMKFMSDSTFTVEYKEGYYLMKIATGENVTYVPIKVVVDTGDIEIKAFQMNTNSAAGGIAEYAPSFRVVSRVSNVMAIGNELHKVQSHGTVYAKAEQLTGDRETEMVIDSANANVNYYQSTDMGVLGSWATEEEQLYNTFYALSFKFEYYAYENLITPMAFRAYAVLDDGTVIYGASDVPAVSIADIAENLYTNEKMTSKDSHEYLYNHVLNIVAMGTNRDNIIRAIMNATNVTSSSSANYQLILQTYNDMLFYVNCVNGYTYSDHNEGFKCSTEENDAEVTALLNNYSGTSYGSVAEWIEAEVTTNGFYDKVEYTVDNTVDDDFDAE